MQQSIIEEGLVIYHVKPSWVRGIEFDSAATDTTQKKSSGDLESPAGLFHLAREPVGGYWRLMQDQVPGSWEASSYDRLDLDPENGAGMGRWSPRGFWGSSDSSSNTFAPYTNPGTGEYLRSSEHPAPPETQDIGSGVAILNIHAGTGADSTLMIFDLAYDQPFDTIKTYTEWDGIVRLQHDVVVAEGETLVVKPGATVVSDANSAKMVAENGTDTLALGNQANRVEVLVLGTLIAEGDGGGSPDSVVFTTSYDHDRLETPEYAAFSDPDTGQWTGVVIRGGGQATLKRCDLGYGRRGVDIEGSLSSGELCASRIHEFAARDVHVRDQGGARLDSCEIWGTEVGIWMRNALVDSSCLAPDSACDRLYVRDSYIHDSRDDGIYARDVVGLRLRRNLVENNAHTGILLKDSWVVLDSNRIRLNAESGGYQLQVLGPKGRRMHLERNYFGGLIGGDTLGWNVFRMPADQKGQYADPDSAFVATTAPLQDTLHAEFCQWNQRTTHDLVTNSPELFLEDGEGQPNDICIDGADISELLVFPWNFWGEEMGKRGSGASAATPEGEEGREPEPPTLSPMSPNPFRFGTTISFTLPRGVGRPLLTVYDVSGRRVKTFALLPGPEGRRTLVWDGRDDRGKAVGSGVYFVRLGADERTITKKLVLVR